MTFGEAVGLDVPGLADGGSPHPVQGREDAPPPSDPYTLAILNLARALIPLTPMGTGVAGTPPPTYLNTKGLLTGPAPPQENVTWRG